MKRTLAIISILLMALQLMLILASWIVSAVMPSYPIHSLLGSGGLRWYIGTFAANLASPWLVYILLASFSYSAFTKSGLLKAITRKTALTMQQKFAFRLMALELLLFVVCVLLISAVPHAILLSVTGALFPSSFSAGLVPMVCFEWFVLSMMYGIMGGEVNTLNKFWDCMVSGANFLPAVCFMYLLIVQLFCSTRYALGV